MSLNNRSEPPPKPSLENDRTHSLRVADERRQKAGSLHITIATGVRYSLQGKCLICDKAIWMGNRCYLCGTGMPRRILRPEERNQSYT